MRHLMKPNVRAGIKTSCMVSVEAKKENFISSSPGKNVPSAERITPSRIAGSRKISQKRPLLLTRFDRNAGDEYCLIDCFLIAPSTSPGFAPLGQCAVQSLH